MPSTALWWIKLDFRLRDNPALAAALAAYEHVVPVFSFEPRILTAPETSAFHVAAWCEALTELRERLRARGGEVLVLDADLPDAFEALRQNLRYDAIYSHEEIGTERTYARDRAVADWAESADVAWHELRQTGVFRGGINRDQRHKAWQRFMEERPLPEPPPEDQARMTVPEAYSALCVDGPLIPERFGHALSETQAQYRQPVSESAAHATLESFLYERGMRYSKEISSPNSAFTSGSRLSVHLAWGTITGRAVYHALEQRRADLKEDKSEEAKLWRRSLTSFRSRLHWRDHFTQRLEDDVTAETIPLNPAYLDLPTPGDHLFDDWLHGRTGWPMVDACMRCAAATGFLNFRMRAMVTSVAVHTLRIDWRLLIHPVARLWADYVPGIHVSQTQMQAGVVGINQLRGYSPDKQFTDHDPEGTFVKQWVPELRGADAKAIAKHTSRQYIEGYRPPLLDDRIASFKSFKEDYYAIKRSPETRALAEEVYAKHGSRRAAGSRTWKSNVPKGKKGASAKTKKQISKPNYGARTQQPTLFADD